MILLGINKDLKSKIGTDALAEAKTKPHDHSTQDRVIAQIFKIQNWTYTQSGWNFFSDAIHLILNYFRERVVVRILKSSLRSQKLELMPSVAVKVAELKQQQADITPAEIQKKLRENTSFNLFKNNELHLLTQEKVDGANSWKRAKLLLREKHFETHPDRETIFAFFEIQSKTLRKAEDYFCGKSNHPPEAKDIKVLFYMHRAINTDPNLIHLLPKNLRRFVQVTAEGIGIRAANHPAFSMILPLLETSIEALEQAECHCKGEANATLTFETAKILINAHLALKEHPGLSRLLPPRLQKFMSRIESLPLFVKIVATFQKIKDHSVAHLLYPLLRIPEDSLLLAKGYYRGRTENRPTQEVAKILKLAYLAMKNYPELHKHLPDSLQELFTEIHSATRFLQSIATDLYRSHSSLDPKWENFEAATEKDLEQIQMLAKRKVKQLPEVSRYGNMAGNKVFLTPFKGETTPFEMNSIESIRLKLAKFKPENQLERNLMLQHLVWNHSRLMIANFSAAIQGLDQKNGEPTFGITNGELIVDIRQISIRSFRIRYLYQTDLTTARNAGSQPPDPNLIGGKVQFGFETTMSWNWDQKKWEIGSPYIGQTPSFKPWTPPPFP